MLFFSPDNEALLISTSQLQRWIGKELHDFLRATFCFYSQKSKRLQCWQR